MIKKEIKMNEALSVLNIQSNEYLNISLKDIEKKYKKLIKEINTEKLEERKEKLDMAMEYIKINFEDFKENLLKKEKLEREKLKNLYYKEFYQEIYNELIEKEKILEKNKQIKDQDIFIKQLNDKIEEMQNTINSLMEYKTTNEKQIKDLNPYISDLKTKINMLIREIEVYRLQIDNFNEEKIKKERINRELKEINEKLQEDKEILKNNINIYKKKNRNNKLFIVFISLFLLGTIFSKYFYNNEIDKKDFVKENLESKTTKDLKKKINIKKVEKSDSIVNKFKEDKTLKEKVNIEKVEENDSIINRFKENEILKENINFEDISNEESSAIIFKQFLNKLEILKTTFLNSVELYMNKEKVLTMTYEFVENELTFYYRELMKQLDEKEKKALKASEIEWIKYKEKKFKERETSGNFTKEENLEFRINTTINRIKFLTVKLEKYKAPSDYEKYNNEVNLEYLMKKNN